METVIFWFNIICFSLMFGAVGLSYILYHRKAEPYRLAYIWYLVLASVWFVLLTFLYFMHTLMASPSLVLARWFGWVRIAVSVGMLYVLQLLFRQLLGYPLKRKQLIVSAVLPLAVLISAIIYQLFSLAWMAILITFIFNFGVGLATLYTYLRLRAKSQGQRFESMHSFLLITGISFTLFGLYAAFYTVTGISPQSFPWSLSLETALTGLFMFLWCCNDLLVFVRKLTVSGSPLDSIPQEFVGDYGISRRELDILELLVSGMSYKEIGEKLFISTRTVETHAYNIFRKCGVKSKVELLNLLYS